MFLSGLDKMKGIYIEYPLLCGMVEVGTKKVSHHSWLFMCKEARGEESHLTAGHCKVDGDLIHNYSDSQ